MCRLRVLAICFASVVVLYGCGGSENDSESTIRLKVATFNINNMYKETDIVAAWNIRNKRIAEYIKNNNFDVVGLQEVHQDQRNYLHDTLGGMYYDWGKNRYDVGCFAGNINDCTALFSDHNESVPVFINRKKFNVISSENFVINKTTDGNYIGFSRLMTLVHIESKEFGNRFYVINTHFKTKDATSQSDVENQRVSTENILKKIAELQKNPSVKIILMGDFNSAEDDADTILRFINESGMIDTYRKVNPNLSSSDRTYISETYKRIDFILASDSSEVQYSKVDHLVSFGTKHVSDHYPVVTELILNYQLADSSNNSFPGVICGSNQQCCGIVLQGKCQEKCVTLEQECP